MDFNFKDYEVWFVTGSQHLYGEEALRQVGKMRKRSPRAWANGRKSP